MVVSVLIVASLLLLHNRTASLREKKKARKEEKQGGFYQNMVNSSLNIIQRPGNQVHNCKIVYCSTQAVTFWSIKTKR